MLKTKKLFLILFFLVQQELLEPKFVFRSQIAKPSFKILRPSVHKQPIESIRNLAGKSVSLVRELPRPDGAHIFILDDFIIKFAELTVTGFESFVRKVEDQNVVCEEVATTALGSQLDVGIPLPGFWQWSPGNCANARF